MLNCLCQVFNSEGKSLRKFGKKGVGASEFKSPNGIAVDSFGNWVVSDYDTKMVQAFTPTGQLIGIISIAPHSPMAICVDRDDRILVAHWDCVNVFCF